MRKIARCIFNSQAQRDFLLDATCLIFKVKDGNVYFKPSRHSSNNTLELESLPDGRRAIDINRRFLGKYLVQILNSVEASYLLLHETSQGWIRLQYIEGVRPKMACCRVYPLIASEPENILNPVHHVTTTHRVVLNAFATVNAFESQNRTRRTREVQEAVRVLTAFEITVSEIEALKRTGQKNENKQMTEGNQLSS